MNLHILDTNMASYIIKGDFPEVREQLETLPMSSIAISVVTEAELLSGLARKGHPPGLTRVIKAFLMRVQILPWDSTTAMVYADLRAACTNAGITLGALDMMIAAHAAAEKGTLVTHDKAFSLIPEGFLTVEDWITR